jgi:hypothetical protein
MIRHIVSWNYAAGFTPPQNRVNARQMKAMLEQLISCVDGIVELKVIIDPLPSGDADVILDALFADEAALAAYQKHPEHQLAGVFVNSVMGNRHCLDYRDE